MRSWLTAPAASILLAFAGCVPADEGLPLGSAQFTITGRGSPRDLVTIDEDFNGPRPWKIHLDRYVLSFKTMTIVNLHNSDQCAYRGRGAVSNVLFDGTVGSVVQSFNGIKPGACPDVGIRLGAPDDRTALGEGSTLDDLISLGSGVPGIAFVEATATQDAEPELELPARTMHLSLRFEPDNTSSAFGGCRDAIPGAKIRPEARYALFVSFAAEAFFRDAIAPNAALRFAPFANADERGNRDDIITMAELDALPLASQFGGVYELPSGARSGSFGNYVRAQFQASVNFGNGGHCNGLDPGTNVDQ
jgi:hypothetical protein